MYNQCYFFIIWESFIIDAYRYVQGSVHNIYFKLNNSQYSCYFYYIYLLYQIRFREEIYMNYSLLNMFMYFKFININNKMTDIIKHKIKMLYIVMYFIIKNIIYKSKYIWV